MLISLSYSIDFITVAAGFIIVLGVKGGFSFNTSTSVFELIAEAGLILGAFVSLEFDIKGMLEL